jgi:hypothetical protein
MIGDNDGNELSGSIEGGELIDFVATCQLLKKNRVHWWLWINFWSTVRPCSYQFIIRPLAVENMT